MIAFVFALGGSGYGLLQAGPDKSSLLVSPWWAGLLRGIFYAAWILFFVLAIPTVGKLFSSVILPRTAKHYPQADKHRDLLYWEHITLHTSNESYHEAVRLLDANLELRNLTDQIYELAHILDAKISSLQKTRQSLLLLSVIWLAGTLSGVIIMLLK